MTGLLFRLFVLAKWRKDIALDAFGYYRRRMASRFKGLIDPSLDFWPFNEEPDDEPPTGV